MRLSLTEARKLWRGATVNGHTDLVLDEDGQPLGIEVTPPATFHVSPSVLGYTEDELDDQED